MSNCRKSRFCVPSIAQCLMLVLFAFACGTSFAQFRGTPGSYELSVPGGTASSTAIVSPDELSIRDAAGEVTVYKRAPRYDTSDQKLIGYSSRQAQQVIRWPSDNEGRMQIGTLQNGQIQFAWSKMTIRQLIVKEVMNEPSDILPQNISDLPQMTAMHLAVGSANQRQFLSLNNGTQFGFVNQASNADSAWYISPVSNNVVRLQQRFQNNWMAIGLNNIPDANVLSHRLGNRRLGNAFPGGGGFRGPSGSLAIGLSPIHNAADQLWRIQNVMGGGGYCFESVLYPGMVLTCLPGTGLSLQPLTYDVWQVWSAVPPVFAMPQPQYRTVEQQIVPNQPLPPSTVRITNSHSDTLLVLVADRRNPQQLQKLRIPAGKAESIQLERDPGATIVERIETMDSLGNWQQQEFNTPIPPSVLYDMSVYEEFLQSIAIDRTGKSPNPIEDVNYQPRSVGFFLVPPGDELPEAADVDAYGIADDAKNPGAVRRLSERDLKKNNAPAADPLKDMLNQFQKQRGAF